MGRRGRGEGSFEVLPSGRVRAVLSKVVDGERVRMTKTFDTKREAVEWRDGHKSKVVRAGTLGDWLDDWLALVKPDAANKTYADDSHRVKKWLKPGLGSLKLRDLTPLRLKQWLAKLAADGVSDSQRHKAGAVLRKALNSAVANGVLASSPMKGVKLPNVKREEKRSLTPDQIATWLAAAGDLAWAFRLWIDAGLRPAELLALRRQDVDTTRGVVSVTRALDGITNEVKEPKTRRSRRVLPLAPTTVRAVADARPTGAGELLVSAPGGTAWWASNFHEKVFAPIRKKAGAGLSWVTPYTFRHTCATLLIQAGVPIKVVSERLGHEDVMTTLRTYAHVMEGDQGKAAAKMDELLNCPLPHGSPTGPECTPVQTTQPLITSGVASTPERI